MHIGPLSPIVPALLLIASPTGAIASDPGTRAIRPDRQTGTSAAVVVPAETALLYTKQMFAPARPAEDPSPEKIASEALDRIDSLLRAGGSGLDRAVRLHVVIDGPELLAGLHAALAERFVDGPGPSLTVVEGALPFPGHRIAIDAVATTTDGPIRSRLAMDPGRLRALPGGPRVFISGQAEPANDLEEATRKTMAGLLESLENLGLSREQIVQLKAFYTPTDSVPDVVQEYLAVFEGVPLPPLVVVEWESSLPIEIELIALAPEPGSDEAIDYLDTPTLAASPVFSRIARVNRGDLVFTSGLTGPEGVDGAAQVEAIFADLAAILDEAGSDFDHLAKATYYVSDDDPSDALNTLRPNYYDPKRPPAASKAMVPGVGLPGRTIAVDMIAVVPGD